MERRPQRKISYALPLTNNCPTGHRLGVSGLSYDAGNGILYSGGRDGIIFAWHADRSAVGSGEGHSTESATKPSCEASSQAHMHWINALTLVHDNEAVVSASSDTTVKIWRPFAEDRSPPRLLGNHTDYVKALATPGSQSNWVFSGGLDYNVRQWDLHEAKERLAIRVTEPGSVKGSIYALAATESVIASGGPENIVKLWDPRSGKRISQLIGHTDNIRGILLSDGRTSDTLISCSADRTVKVWSLTAARCMYSLAIHNDSVWSLYSDHPDLDVFYSGDRSGMIVKTDSRDKHDLDEGYSIALAQEQEGINALVADSGNIWAATAASNINRWRDISKEARFQSLDEARNQYRSHGSRAKTSVSSVPPIGAQPLAEIVPLNCILRLPEVPGGLADAIRSRLRHSSVSRRRASLVTIDNEIGLFAPLRAKPEESIEGSNGLLRCLVLNDKRHVLTADKTGEVIMWNILKCVPIKSFGKRRIDEVFDASNPATSVPTWFEADTNTGALICTLDQDHCFLAEVYADELEEFKDMEIKEDQRINLGVWALRYLFDEFILEELKRDGMLRRQIHEMSGEDLRTKVEEVSLNGKRVEPAPSSESHMNKPSQVQSETTGLRIGLATPLTIPQAPNEGDRTATNGSKEKLGGDYFSSKQEQDTENEDKDKDEALKTPRAEVPTSPTDASAAASPTKDNGRSFGQRLKGTFAPKKGKGPSAEESVASQSETKSSDQGRSSTESIVPQDDTPSSVADLIKEVKTEYIKQRDRTDTARLMPLMTPALPTEAPILKPPANTVVHIHEYDTSSGRLGDLFSGSVGQLGVQADKLELATPYWLGTTLLKNTTPQQDVSKISFLLQPHDQLLANVTADNGKERLNANRLLRARKILGYVIEHLDARSVPQGIDANKPEEALELYCQGQPIHPKSTLMNIRTYIWRSGGDVILTYKPKWAVGESLE
ncbi:MAG: hypothetical protein Q9162_005786 [Coniocarpon cinnabarinum]